MLNIRITSEFGNSMVACGQEETIEQLKKKILLEIESSEGKIFQPEEMLIKLGFPPKTIQPEEDNKSLREMKITNNESLRVEIKKSDAKTQTSIRQAHKSIDYKNTTPEQVDYSKYSIYRKVIKADNSCLFNAINYAMNKCLDEPQKMRELIAVEIQTNSDLYNEAILDKDPFEYCSWIMRSDTWGGGIELSILSKCFQIKIAVADVKNCTIQYFGEVRIILLLNIELLECYILTL